MVRRIAISGKTCSGKSTVTNYLVEKYDFIEMSFAHKLKEIACDLFGSEKKDRELLQLIGEKLRQIDPYVWIRYLFEHIPINENIVISDVRYLNEVVTLKQASFVTIRIEVDKETQRARYKKLYDDVSEDAFYHISEVGLDGYDGFDYVLDGSLPKDELLNAVDDIIGELELEESV